MNNVNGFVFMVSYHQALQKLDSNDRLEMYEAISDYAFNDKEPEFSKNYLEAIWCTIKPNIDNSLKRYSASQENGKKGGRPPKAKEPISTPTDAPISNDNPKEVSQPQKQILTEKIQEIEEYDIVTIKFSELGDIKRITNFNQNPPKRKILVDMGVGEEMIEAEYYLINGQYFSVWEYNTQQEYYNTRLKEQENE